MTIHYDSNDKVEMSQMKLKIESRITKNKAMEERKNVSPCELHESIQSNRISDKKCNKR